MLEEVIESGTLTSTKGTVVRDVREPLRGAARRAARRRLRVRHRRDPRRVAAIDPEPGDEIVTSPITDMGALTPILYQGAIPVFADVDPRTCNVTAETIEPRLSGRTRAIIVTHLFGNPVRDGADHGARRGAKASR